MSSLNVVHQNKWENSWYLKTGDFHHFICYCGQHDTYMCLAAIEHHPYHSCSRCSNDYYLDSVMFMNDSKVIRWSRFFYDFENEKNDGGWHVHVVARVPFFNFQLQKIVLVMFFIVIRHLKCPFTFLNLTIWKFDSSTHQFLKIIHHFYIETCVSNSK